MSRALLRRAIAGCCLLIPAFAAGEGRPPFTPDQLHQALSLRAPVHLVAEPTDARVAGPALKARGALRILIVDDDWSDNNYPSGNPRLSGSDAIFRELVTAAVGGDSAAWSVEVVETHKHGPAFERLRGFNVVLWYTGASYGGGPDNIAVLSLEDEKVARRYLQEVGGSFILVSPGYVNNLSYGSTWTSTAHPFLKEVVGIKGFAGFVQRFAAGEVRARDGSSYAVALKGASETQFSAVNPDDAAVVFTSKLDPKKTAEGAVPVATAHPYGGGRFVYVSFTFENIVEADRAKAFKILLDAAGASPAGVASAPAAGTDPGRVAKPIQRVAPGTTPKRIIKPPLAAPPASAVPAPTGQAAPAAEEPNPKRIWTSLTYFKTAKVKIYTGNDNKEAPSSFLVDLYVNGGASDDNGGLNPNRLVQLARFGPPNQEFQVNSIYESVMEISPGDLKKKYEYIQSNSWGEQDKVTLSSSQQYGLRLDITYEPNFILDAWKIDRVELEIDFGYWERWLRIGSIELGTRSQEYYVSKPAAGFPRVISFNRGALLNNANKKLTLITDGFFLPK